jgi:hypothetical protein
MGPVPPEAVAWYRRIGLAITAAVALSFAWPGTQELAWLTLRYLLAVPGRTTVNGQRPGCVIEDIPNVEFSGPYLRFLWAKGDRTPDDYLVATATHRMGLERLPPPAEQWRGHPAAFWAPQQFMLMDRLPLFLEPSHAADWRPWLHQMLDQAEVDEPRNAAVVAARGLLDIEEGRDLEAERAFDRAAQLPEWDDHVVRAQAYLTRLYVSRGMPPADARALARVRTEPDLGPSVLHALNTHQNWGVALRDWLSRESERRAQERDRSRDATRDGLVLWLHERAWGALLFLVGGLFWAVVICGLPFLPGFGYRPLTPHPRRYRIARVIAFVVAALVLHRMVACLGASVGSMPFT